MLITPKEFKQLFPKTSNQDVWVMAINEICPKYGITRGPRLWMFLAQCGHESNGFSTLSENLNYSRDGLLKIFKKYFNEKDAEVFQRKPQAIANRVYANRIGNGDESSGDGWKFRGRGPIQITGRANYKAFSNETFEDERIIESPDLLSSDPFIGVYAACWFWKKNNINTFADAEDVLKSTKIINGGTHGLDDRVARYKTAKSLLKS